MFVFQGAWLITKSFNYEGLFLGLRLWREGKTVGKGCILEVRRAFATPGFSGNGKEGSSDKSLLISNGGESVVVIGKYENHCRVIFQFSMGDSVEPFKFISSSIVMQSNGTKLVEIKLFDMEKCSHEK